MAKVSILMNCFNGEEYLKQALNSIFSQTFTDWEVIFIDNYSTDNSVNIAKKFGDKVKIYQPPSFCPLGKARNFGLTKCNGDYLAFLDTDDIWLNDKLEKQVHLLLKNPQVAFTYSSFSCIDGEGRLISNRKVNTGRDFIGLIKCYDVNMQTVLINTLAINEGELVFDESLSYNPDFNLFIRLAYNYPILGQDSVFVTYRVLANSLSNKLLSIQIKENLKVLNYLLSIKGMPADYKTVIRKQKEYYFWRSKLSKSIKGECNVNYKCFFYIGFFTTKYWFMLLLYLLPSKTIRSIILKQIHKRNWIS